MEVSREDVLRCAQLACLSLRKDEIEPIRRAMEQMLSHAGSLDELPLAGVEPTTHGPPMVLPLREDVAVEWFTQEQALANAPQAEHGHFVVPKVL